MWSPNFGRLYTPLLSFMHIAVVEEAVGASLHFISSHICAPYVHVVESCLSFRKHTNVGPYTTSTLWLLVVTLRTVRLVSSRKLGIRVHFFSILCSLFSMNAFPSG